MSLTKWDVLGVGCNSVDYVYRLPASPKPVRAQAGPAAPLAGVVLTPMDSSSW